MEPERKTEREMETLSERKRERDGETKTTDLSREEMERDRERLYPATSIGRRRDQRRAMASRPAT